MVRGETYRRRLHERALDQYGYVTAADAEELGIPPIELRKLHQRGGLEHVAYGLYRFEDIPRTPRDQFMEAVLRVGPEAVLAGETVLALHNLALVNPRHIRVYTPRRIRRRLPPFLKVDDLVTTEPERTKYEGIPTTTVARALRDCKGHVMPERLLDATREAALAGLVHKQEADRLLGEFAAL